VIVHTLLTTEEAIEVEIEEAILEEDNDLLVDLAVDMLHVEVTEEDVQHLMQSEDSRRILLMKNFLLINK
jgi:predicted membrane chloride channel (bestrophin family)